MFMKNYFKFFVRILARHKSVSIMAIGCLSIGIAVVLLLGLWVFNEFRYDRFHDNGEHIFRVVEINRDLKRSTGTFRQVGDRMKEGFPEVKAVCRIAGAGLEIRIDNELKESGRMIQTDDNFFTFFTFPLRAGDPKTCLDAPNKMVISEKMARMWFGDKNPIGQPVNQGEYTISAVMEDIPYFSHIQADVVVPFYGRCRDLNCGGNVFKTYLYAPFLTDRSGLEKKLTDLSDENILMKEMGVLVKLEPLKDIHLGPWGSNGSGNKILVYVLGGIALAILLVACINCINLLIVTSFLRAREIGVKKTYGADRRMLIWGSLREISGFVLLALGIAVILALLGLPFFNQLSGCELKLDFTSGFLYVYLAVVYIIALLGAGLYPAFYMTRFNVLQTLNGKFRGKRLSFLQNLLIVVQFTVSIAFLLLIFFVHKQVNYMIDYDLGFDKKNVICSYAPMDMVSHYEAVRNELLGVPDVKEVTIRNALPMYWADGYPIQKQGSTERVQFEVCEVGDNYFDMMGIEWIEGENPFRNREAYHDAVLDENAVKQLELKEPVGSVLVVWGLNFTVKGVVQSVYSKKMDRKSDPVFYMPIWESGWNHYVIMCKVEGNPREAIRAMQRIWERYLGDRPFAYRFLDDEYSELYRSETRLQDIFFWVMIITLLLSVAGLFAMAYYTMLGRMKEIGIRKVNGATLGSLMFLLNMNFIRLTALSFGIACILSYYFLSYWLESFVVQTSLSWWVFAGAGGIAFLVTLLTVSYLTFRAVRVKPVEVLKNE